MLIQKLRLKKGWSQQQLASASGLSARTIQRLEAGHPPSIESLKSIAAVFEVDFETLNPNPISTNPPPQRSTMPNIESTPSLTAQTDDQEAEAFRQVRELRGFYLHFIKYVAFTSGLAIINHFTSPHYPWVLWVIGGWGIGIASHAIRVLKPQLFLGPQWERQQVEKRLGRSL